MTSPLTSELTITLGTDPARIVIGENAIGQLPHMLDRLGTRRITLVADRAAWNLHGGRVGHALSRWPTTVSRLDAGERIKTLATVARLAEGSTKDASDGQTVVAFGGGVAVNVAGPPATLLNWGSPLVHVPTTLVAMADAAPSARHGLNTGTDKGALGLLNPPAAIVCDPCFVRTLPAPALRDGLIEILKTALAAGGGDWLSLAVAAHAAAATPADSAHMTAVITSAIKLKASLLDNDAVECGASLALHYGHTFSRAIESATGYLIRHGEAVAAGMLLAAQVAEKCGILPALSRREHAHWVCAISGRRDADRIVRHIGTQQLLNWLMGDSNTATVARPSHTGLILLSRLGAVHWPPGADAPVTPVSRSAVATALRPDAPSRLGIGGQAAVRGPLGSADGLLAAACEWGLAATGLGSVA